MNDYTSLFLLPIAVVILVSLLIWLASVVIARIEAGNSD